MSLKMSIVVIVLLLVAMPFVHHQGRVSMKDEFVQKNAYVMDGKLAFKELIRAGGICGNCHTQGGV